MLFAPPLVPLWVKYLKATVSHVCTVYVRIKEFCVVYNFTHCSNLAKARSLTHINRSDLPPEIRDLLDEKEQALLASQETVQVCIL